MPDMTLTFNYTKEEDIEALRKIFIRIFNLKIFVFVAVLFMFIGIVGLLYVRPHDIFYIVEIVGSITFFLIILYEIYIHPKAIAKKRSSLYGENTVKLVNEGIEIKTKNYSSNFTWNFKKLFQSDNFYVLFTDRINFLIIPRNVFETKDEETTFLTLISEKTLKKFTKI